MNGTERPEGQRKVTVAEKRIDDLAQRYASGRDAECRDQLCELVLSFVRSLAVRVHSKINRRREVEDLFSDGCVGLLQAIDKYDPDRNSSFLAWARPHIYGKMLNACRKADFLPESARTDLRRIREEWEQVAQQKGADVSMEDVARGLGFTPDKLKRMRKAYLMNDQHSLDAPRSEAWEDSSLMDSINGGDPDPGDIACSSMEMREMFDCLSEREKKVVTDKYIFGKKMCEIAQEMGVTKQRISQIHIDALNKIRENAPADMLERFSQRVVTAA